MLFHVSNSLLIHRENTVPIFGTQFHPELQNDAHRDGQRILENFFAHYVK